MESSPKRSTRVASTKKNTPIVKKSAKPNGISKNTPKKKTVSNTETALTTPVLSPD